MAAPRTRLWSSGKRKASIWGKVDRSRKLSSFWHYCLEEFPIIFLNEQNLFKWTKVYEGYKSGWAYVIFQNDVFSFPILDETYKLKCTYDIVGENARLERYVFHWDFRFVNVIAHVSKKLGFPVVAITDQPKIGQGSFGRADFLLFFGQQIAEVDQYFSEAFIHERRQYEYTREVKVHNGLLFFGEVADHFEGAVFLVVVGQYVE